MACNFIWNINEIHASKANIYGRFGTKPTFVYIEQLIVEKIGRYKISVLNTPDSIQFEH